uniref:Uncharacterized protein n=1 Tax=Tanacetum cinerariifolium TaxID=118510 RepID=A0A6L2NXS1_TANCI|nr:hypothetical protein [Tanacetum cinerariifolium]
MERAFGGSRGEPFWKEGYDFEVDVLHFHTCLTDILGFLEKLEWWFEQDIDDEGEEDEEGEGGSEVWELYDLNNRKDRIKCEGNCKQAFGGSRGESFWKEGYDFEVDVLHFHTSLTDILGFLEKLEWWFEQDIDDEGEEDEEGEGDSEVWELYDLNNRKDRIKW